MINLIIFLLIGIGLTFILTESYIFDGLRNFIGKKSLKLGYMIHCSQCTGFWIGLSLSFIFLNFTLILNPITYGLMLSGICYLLTQKINFK